MESAENQAQPGSNQNSEAENNPSLSKTETIALLNESIDRLEETIAQISNNSANVPTAESLDTLVTTTQELEAAVAVPTPDVAEPVATESPEQPITPQAETPEPAPVEAELDSPPPTPAQSRSTRNTGLIAIAVTAVAIALVTVVWLWKPPQLAKLFPQTESTPTEIVVAPTTDITIQPIDTAINLVETPATESEVDIDSPADNLEIVGEISTIEFPPEIESVAKPQADVVETVIPEVLTSPERPKKLKMVAIKPKLNFTPEQSLVAVLDTKISELIKTYPQQLIQEVLVDLPDSSLLVRVADDWYDLDALEQDNLGNQILERARAFSFQKLELRDSSGTLVARNPIVGDKIIILPNPEASLNEL